jgi:hypothetical protein
MDDSLATDELPDCPKCRRKLTNVKLCGGGTKDV